MNDNGLNDDGQGERKSERYDTVFLVSQIQTQRARNMKIGIGVGVVLVLGLLYFVFLAPAPKHDEAMGLPHGSEAPSGALAPTAAPVQPTPPAAAPSGK